MCCAGLLAVVLALVLLPPVAPAQGRQPKSARQMDNFSAKGASLAAEDRYGNQPLWNAVFNDKGPSVRIDMVKLLGWVDQQGRS